MEGEGLVPALGEDGHRLLQGPAGRLTRVDLEALRVTHAGEHVARRYGDVLGTLLTPSTVCGVAVNAQTNRVYVSTQETGSVSVLDPQAGSRAVIETRSLFGSTRATEVLPNDIDVNPQGDAVSVVNKTARSLVTATGGLAPS